MQAIKKLWGTGQSKGFKVAAWVVAFGGFAAWQYVSTPASKPASKKLVSK